MAKRRKIERGLEDEFYWKEMSWQIFRTAAQVYELNSYKRLKWLFPEVGQDFGPGLKTVVEIVEIQSSDPMSVMGQAGIAVNWAWALSRNWKHDQVKEIQYHTAMSRQILQEKIWSRTFLTIVAGTSFVGNDTDPQIVDMTSESASGSRIGAIVYSPVMWLHWHNGAQTARSALNQAELYIRLKCRVIGVDAAWYARKTITNADIPGG